LRSIWIGWPCLARPRCTPELAGNQSPVGLTPRERLDMNAA